MKQNDKGIPGTEVLRVRECITFFFFFAQIDVRQALGIKGRATTPDAGMLMRVFSAGKMYDV